LGCKFILVVHLVYELFFFIFFLLLFVLIFIIIQKKELLFYLSATFFGKDKLIWLIQIPIWKSFLVLKLCFNINANWTCDTKYRHHIKLKSIKRNTITILLVILYNLTRINQTSPQFFTFLENLVFIVC
jgi:hypothetical protein